MIKDLVADVTRGGERVKSCKSSGLDRLKQLYIIRGRSGLLAIMTVLATLSAIVWGGVQVAHHFQIVAEPSTSHVPLAFLYYR
jgi:hypothetical protein